MALAVLVPAVWAPSRVSAGGPRVETFEVPSACVDTATVVMADPPPGAPARPARLRVRVVLPTSYDGQRAFPVLYLLHGLGGAFDSWTDDSRGELAKAIDGLNAIVVMPEAGVMATYANSWSGGSRRPCWRDYFLNEVVPTIESRFRVRPGRRWHAIGGFSSGGLGAVLFAASAPDYFGQVLSFSGVLSTQRPENESGAAVLAVMALYMPGRIAEVGPTPWRDAYGDPSAQEFYWAGNNPVVLAAGLSHSRVYVAHGGPTAPTCLELKRPTTTCAGPEVLGGVAEATINGEWAKDFMTAARAAGVEVTYRPQPGGHWYEYSARFLSDAIHHWDLFAPVPERPTGWTYKTVATSGDMWGIGFAFEQPPMALATFTRTGNGLSGRGVGTVRLELAPGCVRSVDLPFDVELSCALSDSRPSQLHRLG